MEKENKGIAVHLDKLDSSLFDWIAWRSGSPANFLISCRFEEIMRIRMELKRHAVGYCDAASIPCRPKLGCKAVMFFKDGMLFWFHLTDREFRVIYEA